ncbi:MAG TPA: hypothetical protein VF572_06735 [Candidatus Saccharimonadales bacterium]
MGFIHGKHPNLVSIGDQTALRASSHNSFLPGPRNRRLPQTDSRQLSQ